MLKVVLLVCLMALASESRGHYGNKFHLPYRHREYMNPFIKMKHHMTEYKRLQDISKYLQALLRHYNFSHRMSHMGIKLRKPNSPRRPYILGMNPWHTKFQRRPQNIPAVTTYTTEIGHRFPTSSHSLHGWKTEVSFNQNKINIFKEPVSTDNSIQSYNEKNISVSEQHIVEREHTLVKSTKSPDTPAITSSPDTLKTSGQIDVNCTKTKPTSQSTRKHEEVFRFNLTDNKHDEKMKPHLNSPEEQSEIAIKDIILETSTETEIDNFSSTNDSNHPDTLFKNVNSSETVLKDPLNKLHVQYSESNSTSLPHLKSDVEPTIPLYKLKDSFSNSTALEESTTKVFETNISNNIDGSIRKELTDLLEFPNPINDFSYENSTEKNIIFEYTHLPESSTSIYNLNNTDFVAGSKNIENIVTKADQEIITEPSNIPDAKFTTDFHDYSSGLVDKYSYVVDLNPTHRFTTELMKENDNQNRFVSTPIYEFTSDFQEESTKRNLDSVNSTSRSITSDYMYLTESSDADKYSEKEFTHNPATFGAPTSRLTSETSTYVHKIIKTNTDDSTSIELITENFANESKYLTESPSSDVNSLKKADLFNISLPNTLTAKNASLYLQSSIEIEVENENTNSIKSSNSSLNNSSKTNVLEMIEKNSTSTKHSIELETSDAQNVTEKYLQEYLNTSKDNILETNFPELKDLEMQSVTEEHWYSRRPPSDMSIFLESTTTGHRVNELYFLPPNISKNGIYNTELSIKSLEDSTHVNNIEEKTEYSERYVDESSTLYDFKPTTNVIKTVVESKLDSKDSTDDEVYTAFNVTRLSNAKDKDQFVDKIEFTTTINDFKKVEYNLYLYAPSSQHEENTFSMTVKSNVKSFEDIDIDSNTLTEDNPLQLSTLRNYQLTDESENGLSFTTSRYFYENYMSNEREKQIDNLERIDNQLYSPEDISLKYNEESTLQIVEIATTHATELPSYKDTVTDNVRLNPVTNIDDQTESYELSKLKDSSNDSSQILKLSSSDVDESHIPTTGKNSSDSLQSSDLKYNSEDSEPYMKLNDELINLHSDSNDLLQREYTTTEDLSDAILRERNISKGNTNDNNYLHHDEQIESKTEVLNLLIGHTNLTEADTNKTLHIKVGDLEDRKTLYVYEPTLTSKKEEFNRDFKKTNYLKVSNDSIQYALKTNNDSGGHTLISGFNTNTPNILVTEQPGNLKPKTDLSNKLKSITTEDSMSGMTEIYRLYSELDEYTDNTDSPTVHNSVNNITRQNVDQHQLEIIDTKVIIPRKKTPSFVLDLLNNSNHEDLSKSQTFNKDLKENPQSTVEAIDVENVISTTMVAAKLNEGKTQISDENLIFNNKTTVSIINNLTPLSDLPYSSLLSLDEEPIMIKSDWYEDNMYKPYKTSKKNLKPEVIFKQVNDNEKDNSGKTMDYTYEDPFSDYYEPITEVISDNIHINDKVKYQNNRKNITKSIRRQRRSNEPYISSNYDTNNQSKYNILYNLCFFNVSTDLNKFKHIFECNRNECCLKNISIKDIKKSKGFKYWTNMKNAVLTNVNEYKRAITSNANSNDTSILDDLISVNKRTSESFHLNQKIEKQMNFNKENNNIVNKLIEDNSNGSHTSPRSSNKVRRKRRHLDNKKNRNSPSEESSDSTSLKQSDAAAMLALLKQNTEAAVQADDAYVGDDQYSYEYDYHDDDSEDMKLTDHQEVKELDDYYDDGSSIFELISTNITRKHASR